MTPASHGMGIVCLLLAATVAAAGVASALPADDVELCEALPLLAVVDPVVLAAPPAPRASFVVPGDRDLTVRWRVMAREEGLRLRLYGGHGLGALVLLAEDAAELGEHDYQLSDHAPFFGFVLYELRVVDHTGCEQSLGSIAGVASVMSGQPVAVAVPTPLAADLVGRPALGVAPIGSAALATEPVVPCFVREVPTPPPRHGASRRSTAVDLT